MTATICRLKRRSGRCRSGKCASCDDSSALKKNGQSALTHCQYRLIACVVTTRSAEEEKNEKEKERRRNMTDEEVAAENEKLGRNDKTRGEMKFMQKYYHPGVYYVVSLLAARPRVSRAPTFHVLVLS